MADPNLARIRRSPPLHEEVAQRLRSFIDIEQLKPGERLLSERELAQRLGVSRTSVRQALTALRVAGLVEIRHGDGVYVKEESPESQERLPAILEIRLGLEAQTARLAARRRTDADLGEMASALVEMDAAIAAHHHILDAIRAQEEEASTAAMRAHVDEVAAVAFD